MCDFCRFSQQINVVTDNRKYLSWKENAKGTLPDAALVEYQPVDSGMHAARRALNELHRMLANKGYNQVIFHNHLTDYYQSA